jgi:O-antigen/teichoic acid export membrane protein
MKRSLIEYIVTKLPSSFREHFSEISKDEISGRIVRSSFWALSGSVISKGFLLLSSILIARILGKSLYGEFGIIQSTINMFAVIAGFGLGVTSTKYVAELRDNDPDRAGNIIASFNLAAGIFGFCFTLIFIIITPLISEKLISTSQLTGDMRLGAVMLFF